MFAFDFRNHGTSDRDPSYNPLQWTSDREVADLRGALRYLRSRPDHDPAGFGLFGVSRGGTTALIAAADEPDVWGVVTDGAFPTRLMTVKYMIRWSEIFVRSQLLLSVVPLWFYYLLAWVGRVRSQRRHNCCFLEVETALKRLAPASVADDSRGARCLYQPGNRTSAFRRRPWAQGILACAGGKAQSLPRTRAASVRCANTRLSRSIRPAPTDQRSAPCGSRA